MLSRGPGSYRWKVADGDQVSWPASTDQLARSLTDGLRGARRRALRWWRFGPTRPVVIVCVAAGVLAIGEAQTSWLQSRLLAAAGRRISYTTGPGPSPSVRYPAAGPYDVRLGYTRVPTFVHRLHDHGFAVTRQVRWSAMAQRVVEYGLFPIYEEKGRAGLRIRGREGRLLYASPQPVQQYARFEDIPAILVRSLLFVENRELLDERQVRKNPAIEFPRLLRAITDLGRRVIDDDYPVSGGSTLATQLEKVRHSPEGRTGSVTEKARQMLSASLRAYRDGEFTGAARRQIVRDYINALPLGAAAGYGEVTGLADGLSVWYGAEPSRVNRQLEAAAQTMAGDPRLGQRATAYRQALSLILAARRPTTYLQREPAALEARVDAYLRALTDAGLVPPALGEAALTVRLSPRTRLSRHAPIFADRKGTDGIRHELVSRLGLTGTYELDRLDLDVRTTLDGRANADVSRALAQLGDREVAHHAGLTAERLLGNSSPDGVVYSVTIFERTPEGNRLRVEADNYDRPLSISEGTRLELGSTAKLRVLATYLEIVARLHAEYAAWSPERLRAVRPHRSDRLRAWAVDYLARARDRSLGAMIEAALLRRYSANPAEAFFTGRGLHRFGNFDARHDSAWLSVRDGFRESVNLVFIRLMRDVESHYVNDNPEWAGVLHDASHPARAAWLARFADREGREFLERFYRRHQDATPDDALAALADGASGRPSRLAAIFRAVSPERSVEALGAFLQQHARGQPLRTSRIETLFDQVDPARLSWQDLGYVARVHPLELWLVRYLYAHPRASLQEVIEASAVERQEAYRWLFRTRNSRARQRAVETLVEAAAFERIHASWQRHGYPFDSLVPSLATALGSSGDNPAALSELLGIIVNDGRRRPAVRVDEILLAEGTPYETALALRPSRGERVMPAEVAAALRRELVGVVERGTGRRLAGGVTLTDGRTLAIGGKTGTGDNRFDTDGPGGRRSRVVNRTASFAFTIGDRFFGTVVAFVPGPEAAGYAFTSALPVQLLKNLLPLLDPLLESADEEQGRPPAASS